MAQSLNKHQIIGNVGADPTVSSYQERKVAQLRVATSEVWKDRDGNKQEKTDWHNVVAWTPIAEIVEQFVKKGARIYVEGKSRTREYTGNDGVKRYITEIIADNLILLDRKVSEGGDRTPAPAPEPQYQQPRQQRQPQNQGAAPQYGQRTAAAQQHVQDFGDGLGMESDDMPAF